MPVPVAPVEPATPETWGRVTTTSRSATELDDDSFLKLLVAQLRYQDPLSPSDPQAFLAQTAQFTSVQKLEQIAAQGTEQSWAMSVSTASALVGRTVTYLRPDGSTGSGVVGSALTDPQGIVLDVSGEEVPLGAINKIAPGPA